MLIFVVAAAAMALYVVGQVLALCIFLIKEIAHIVSDLACCKRAKTPRKLVEMRWPESPPPPLPPPNYPPPWRGE